MHIGFTGSRSGLSANQEATILRIFESIPNIESAHHGDCVGADADFHALCHASDLLVTLHPPTDNKSRAFCLANASRPAKPYLQRNQEIVNSCSLLIAAPNGPETRRSGTWATIRYARKNRRRLAIVNADGQLQLEFLTPKELGL